jgi:hypothetical protein
MPCDEIRLWEITENLHRADLTVQERCDQITEWVRLTDGKGVSAHVAPKLSSRGRQGEGRPESGINAAVRDLGIDRTEAQRALPDPASSLATMWSENTSLTRVSPRFRAKPTRGPRPMVEPVRAVERGLRLV